MLIILLVNKLSIACRADMVVFILSVLHRLCHKLKLDEKLDTAFL